MAGSSSNSATTIRYSCCCSRLQLRLDYHKPAPQQRLTVQRVVSPQGCTDTATVYALSRKRTLEVSRDSEDLLRLMGLRRIAWAMGWSFQQCWCQERAWAGSAMTLPAWALHARWAQQLLDQWHVLS